VIFLGDEWLARMDRAARAISVAIEIVVEQVVREVPGRGEVRYHMVFSPAGGRVAAGPAGTPELRLTTDYETAVALARGDTNAQESLARGRIRIGGDINALVVHGDVLSSLADVFAGVREQTEYPRG
jgi:hypothetical protein